MTDLNKKQKELINQLFVFINQSIDLGASEESISKTLIEKGLSKETVEVLIKSAKTQRQYEFGFLGKRIERSNKGLGKMIFGGLLFLVGGIVTLVSYAQASGGGSYVLWYGALIVGGINFFIGLIQRRS